MITPEKLQYALTLALHPEIRKQKRLQLATQQTIGETLPQPTPAILHWIETTTKWLEESPHNREGLFPSHPLYPKSLYDLSDCPVILFAQGNLNLLNTPSLALVGSRNASKTGLRLAYDFAYDLAKQGWCVVSGLAEGIDGASHQGALAAHGPTIAVLGGALDKLYPKIHTKLAHQIVTQNGLLLSEYPPGTDPRPMFFPQRNRIIAGLSEAVLLVEAAKRSGSLITARFASEMGRLVMALPGSIHSTHSKGCHDAIKKGALLVETVGEITHELKASLKPEQTKHLKHMQQQTTQATNPKPISATPNTYLDDDLNQILQLLSDSPCHVDDLIQQSNLPCDTILSALTELELEGWVICEAGNR